MRDASPDSGRVLRTAQLLAGGDRELLPAALIAAALLQVAEVIEKGQASEPKAPARPPFPETTHEAQR